MISFSDKIKYEFVKGVLAIGLANMTINIVHDVYQNNKKEIQSFIDNAAPGTTNAPQVPSTVDVMRYKPGIY